MVMTPNRASYIALRRFGLGARPGEAGMISSDPRGYVLEVLSTPLAPIDPGPDTAQINREVWAMQAEEKKAREIAATPPTGQPAPATGAGSMGAAPAMGMSPPSMGAAPPSPSMGAAPPGNGMGNAMGMAAPTAPGAPPKPRLPRYYYETAVADRLARQIDSRLPLHERLVSFWSNHFCISADKSDHVRATAGSFENEAVRPFVLGRFRDMLTAVSHHPTMLQYLDNHVSTGPNSKAGKRELRGLNENLGREIMELHTLGVDAGYSQSDVTEFARAITGWTIAYANDKQVEPGRFRFQPDRHEPGSFTIMGKTYDQQGDAQGQAALDDFARHPATSRHIARKLVRHFVGDEAPAALVDKVAAAFRDSDGDLKVTTNALVTADEAWAAAPVKVLAPWDLLVVMARGLGISWNFGEANRMLTLFGQPTWEVPFPAGWPDTDTTWASPDSLLELLDAAFQLSRRNAGDRNIVDLADQILGPLVSDATRTAIRRAETREQGMALLLMSPEFLRR